MQSGRGARWCIGLALVALAGCPAGSGAQPPGPGPTTATVPAPTQSPATAVTPPPPTPGEPPVGPTGPGTGTITGTVQSPYMRLVGAVVYIQAIPGRRFDPPATHAVMDQHRKVFTPHLLPVLVGTVVDFPNTDETRHSVYSRDGPHGFNLGEYPAGEVKHECFAKPGVTHLGCKIHAEMSAYVIVCQNPFFARIDKRAHGQFTLDGVPAGHWRLALFHEHLQPAVQPVTVTAGGTTAVTFEGLKRK